MEEPIENSTPPRYLQREAARRNADSIFGIKQQRNEVAKQQAASASAATDAKTARLRALRLARDEADKISALAATKMAPRKKSALAAREGDQEDSQNTAIEGAGSRGRDMLPSEK